MRQRRDVYLTKLNKDLDDRMEKGTHKPCIQAKIIQDKEAKLNKEELTSISLTMLSGGLDTVTTLVAWSIALLGQRPDIQEKAVREIRKMYSEEEILCDAEDEMKCEYVMALAKECLRYVQAGRIVVQDANVFQILHSSTSSSSTRYGQGHHVPRQTDPSRNHDILECVGMQHGPQSVETAGRVHARKMARAARCSIVHVWSWLSNVCGKLAGEPRTISRFYEDVKLLRD